MKQCIEFDQLEELSEKQRERLDEWWKNNYRGIAIENGGDTYCDGGDCSCDGEGHGSYYDHFPLLSIGQMIEFLEEEYNTSMASWQGWAITIDQGRGINVHGYENKELCDALWSAVKDVLNQE